VIELHFFPSPNGQKVAIALEECGLPYRVVPVDLAKGEQFDPAYLALNPNNKIPTLVDPGGPGGRHAVFESGAILLYLAEKTGQLLPTDPAARSEALQWLFWQVGGLGPMAGQAHHFRAFAPEQVPYAIRRYTDECNRLYGVLDRRLARREWLAGEYSVADIACWPWIRPWRRQGQDLDAFPHLARWFEAVGRRPAVCRALELGDERLLSAEEYRLLLNQTAARVDALSARRSRQD
jgi:GST-like protein